MFNKTATAIGLSLGAVSSVSANNHTDMTDSIVELLPIIVELAVIFAMLTYIMKLLRNLN